MKTIVMITALLVVLPGFAGAEEQKPVAKPSIAKVCLNCHEAKENNLRGYYDNIAMKSKSIQLRLDEAVEIVKFDPETLKVVDGAKTEKAEFLRKLPKGKEIRIEYSEKDGVKTALTVVIKQPIKLPPEKQVSLAELERLVALGPVEGKYTLVDSRPVPRVQEGMIPTAINIPYPAFDKMVEKLPKDKDALLIFYCAGVTCAMSPNSLRKAEKLGYTNVKVFHEGMPVWSKKHYGLLSPQFLKEAWIDKEIPHVLLDVRAAKIAGEGFIKGAVGFPANRAAQLIKMLPDKEKKAPIMIYDARGGDDAKAVAEKIVLAGQSKVMIITGGLDAWEGAKFPLEKGKLGTRITYVPKPRPGSIEIAEFKKILKDSPADVVILDVRNPDEANAGMFKGAVLMPADEIVTRFAELPKEKTIIAHCSTGIRAEMAYHTLKEKGFNHVKFLYANVEIDKKGKYKLELP